MNYLDMYNIKVVNGSNGPYDNKINNASVKYGRNTTANYFEYLKSYTSNPIKKEDLDMSNISQLDQDQFDKKMKAAEDALSTPAVPLKFTYKYLPELKIDFNNLNKMSLLGTAFEELGKKVSVSVADFNENLKKAFDKDDPEKMSAEAMDINHDGQIDVGEYASSILLADMLSTNTQELDPKNIKGEINNDGQNNSLAYINKKNLAQASEIFKGIYDYFGLNKAAEEFKADPNNTIN